MLTLGKSHLQVSCKLLMRGGPDRGGHHLTQGEGSRDPAAEEGWAGGLPTVGEGDSGAGATQCAMPVLGEELTSSTGWKCFLTKPQLYPNKST